MVGIGIRMGWDIPEVPGGAGGDVVASESCSGFSVQVPFSDTFTEW